MIHTKKEVTEQLATFVDFQSIGIIPFGKTHEKINLITNLM